MLISTQTKNKIIKALKAIGLNKNEIAVYLAGLQLGKASIAQVAKKAQINRTTAYGVIESLLNKRLLSKFEDQKGQKLLAEGPEKLLNILQQKQGQLLEIMPDLLAVTKTESDIRPEVKFYQGREGLKAVYEDTLTSCQKDGELVGYFSDEPLHFLPDYTLGYIRRRVEKGIKSRGIALDSKATRKHKLNDRKELRQTKIVNEKEFPVCIEKNIYADKVAFMNYRRFPFGVIIKSPQIAKSEKAIFELLWKKLPG